MDTGGMHERVFSNWVIFRVLYVHHDCYICRCCVGVCFYILMWIFIRDFKLAVQL